MTCRESGPLLMAERDGALTPAERTVLSDHLAACAACRQWREQLATSQDAYRAAVAAVTVPDANEAWRELQPTLRVPAGRTRRKRLAPVIWFGTPLAAAAALVFAFNVVRTPTPVAPTKQPAAQVATGAVRMRNAAAANPVQARADFVEAGDPNASTLVYVDKDSGWLVVWAASATDGNTSG